MAKKVLRQGQLFECFDRLSKLKKERKELKAMYKDALAGNQEFQKVKESLDKLKEEKKSIEAKIKEVFASEMDKIDVLNNEIKNDSQVLSDIVLAKVSKGEKVDIVDEYDQKLFPVFSVKFVKE